MATRITLSDLWDGIKTGKYLLELPAINNGKQFFPAQTLEVWASGRLWAARDSALAGDAWGCVSYRRTSAAEWLGVADSKLR